MRWEMKVQDESEPNNGMYFVRQEDCRIPDYKSLDN